MEKMGVCSFAMKQVCLRAIVALFAGVIAASSANAQVLSDSVLHPGARIRIQSRALGANPRVGTFLSLANDTLSFTPERSAAPTRLSVTQIDALEVSVQRTTNILRDADKGSHYGGWLGAAVLGGLAVAGAPSGDNGLRALLGLGGAVAGYFVGRMYGTVAGGVAGVMDRDDEWKPVMLPAHGAQ